MIEARARVVAVPAVGEAWVQARRTSACAACARGQGCGLGPLIPHLAARPVMMRAANPVGAEPGEEVAVGIGERALLRGALTLYALPIVSMIVMAALTGAASQNEAAVLVMGGAGLWIGLRGVRRLSRASGGDSPYRPIVLRRCPQPSGEASAP